MAYADIYNAAVDTAIFQPRCMVALTQLAGRDLTEPEVEAIDAHIAAGDIGAIATADPARRRAAGLGVAGRDAGVTVTISSATFTHA